MSDPTTVPMYATYAPRRSTGAWKLHETASSVRNSIAQNGWNKHVGWDEETNHVIYERVQDVRYVFALRHDGTWERLTPDQITKEWV